MKYKLNKTKSIILSVLFSLVSLISYSQDTSLVYNQTEDTRLVLNDETKKDVILTTTPAMQKILFQKQAMRYELRHGVYHGFTGNVKLYGEILNSKKLMSDYNILSSIQKSVIKNKRFFHSTEFNLEMGILNEQPLDFSKTISYFKPNANISFKIFKINF